MSESRAGDTRLLTVGEAASLAHASVRTLHHYDEIGLVAPADRSDAGYRLYGPAELERLHQVLLFRELGFGLDAIGPLLDAPAADRRAALLTQRVALERRGRRIGAVLRAVDRAIDAMERGRPMETNELFEGFEDFDHARYADEAEERWGDTDAYAEAQRRTKGYDRKDWTAMKAEQDQILAAMASLMEGGARPTDPACLDVAEKHRRHIDRWFYPCSPEMHVGLADMYEADARFREHFDSRADGLAGFMAAAIRGNADRGSMIDNR
jgi:DNA-binding transcriptional MerR regulator